MRSLGAIKVVEQVKAFSQENMITFISIQKVKNGLLMNKVIIVCILVFSTSVFTFLNAQDRSIKKPMINNYYFVPTDEIKYIISSAYYAEIFTEDNNKHIYRISLNEFIVKLNNNFMRINRSAIIHNRFIKEIISEGMGGYSIVMKDGKSFSLSKKYKDIVLAQLNIRNKSNE